MENNQENDLFVQIDRGIDDMEAGRELPLEEAFAEIGLLREEKHRKRRQQETDSCRHMN